MLMSSLCYYSDAYFIDRRNITITGAGQDGAEKKIDERDKWVTLKILHHLLNAYAKQTISK